MPLPFNEPPADNDRRAMEDALVEVRVAFAHEGGYIDACLTRLAEMVETHSHVGTSSQLLDEIVEHEPRLGADVETLRRDHEELPPILADLRRRLADLRDAAAEACDRIVHHHRLGDHLTYEAFIADIGVGD